MSQGFPKPIYTTVESVKVRLANKVQFQSQAILQDGEIPDALLNQIIVDAETAVEQYLRGRYAIPFQSKTTLNFSGLPDHSKRAIRVACDLMSVIRILGTDFGSGSAVNGENYRKSAIDDYNDIMAGLLGLPPKDASDEQLKQYRRFQPPPLDDVLLSPTNAAADDGYKGAIGNTDQNRHGAEAFAEHQLNDPADRWFPGLRRGY